MDMKTSNGLSSLKFGLNLNNQNEVKEDFKIEMPKDGLKE